MAAGAFLTGLLKGNVSTAAGMKDKENKGLLRGKKKSASPLGPSDYGPSPDQPGFKRGGKVKHTGRAKVHRGERVLTKSQSRRYGKKRSKR